MSGKDFMSEIEDNRENVDSAEAAAGASVGTDAGAGAGMDAGAGVGTAAGAAAGAGAGVSAEIMPVAGLGVDIIEIERMERAMARTPRIRERIFSENERNYAQGKLRPGVHFALFFAAKEAVFKALGTGFAGMAFTDVEVDHDRFGRPVPILRGRAKELAQQQSIVEMQLSLSYTHTVGVASAVAIKERDRPRKETKADPRAELLRQFKEVRAILDDMDERLLALDESLQETLDNTLDNKLHGALNSVPDNEQNGSLSKEPGEASGDVSGDVQDRYLGKTLFEA